MKYLHYLSMFLAGVAVISCKNSDEPTPPEPAQPLIPTIEFTGIKYHKDVPFDVPSDVFDISEKANRFAFKIFNSNPDCVYGNGFSPFALYSSLSFLANCDNGATQEEILKLLEYAPEDLPKLNKFMGIMIPGLANLDKSVKCNVAPSLSFPVWTHPRQSILDLAKDYYDCTINPNQNTLDKNQIAISSEFEFQAPWHTPFIEENISPGDFYYEDKVTKATFMEVSRPFMCAQTEDFDMVMAELGNGANFQLFLIMPKKDLTDKKLMESLTYEDFDNLLLKSSKRQLNLKIPMAKGFRSTFSVNKIISESKLNENILSNGLNAITETTCFPEDVILRQPQFIMNDNGIGENVECQKVRIQPDNRNYIDITFNHPSLYIIREADNEVIVKMGILPVTTYSHAS